MKTWKLNVRFFIGLALVIVVGAISVYSLFIYQQRRNAAAFLRRADQRATENDHRDAAKNLYRYLELVPDDVDARIRLAEYFDLSAQTYSEKQRAVRLYFDALAVAPDRVDLRCRQAELLLEVGRFDKALEEAESVLAVEQRQHDHTGLAVKAIALHQLAQRDEQDISYTDVAEALREAIHYNRGSEKHVELASRLASVYRDESRRIDREQGGERKLLPQPDRDRLADETMDDMVAANPDRFLAYFARYLYRKEHGIPGADADLDQALGLDLGESSSVYLAVAGRALQAGALDEARSHFEEVIETFPGDRRGYLGLAQSYVAQSVQTRDRGDLNRAVEVLRDGLAKVGPEDFALNAQLARVLIRSRRLTEADDALSVLAKVRDELTLNLPGPQRARMRATVDLLRAEKLVAEGSYSQVEDLLQRVLIQEQAAAATPEDASGASGRGNEIRRRTYSLLGTAFGALGQWDRAAEALEKAVALAPQSVRFRLAAGQAWEQAGRLDLAIRHYRWCTDNQAGADDQVLLRLAQALIRRQLVLPEADRDWQPVQAVLDQVQQRSPDSFAVKLFAAKFAATQGNTAGAVTSLQEAEKTLPNSASDWRTIVFMYQQLGQPALADQAVQRFAQLVTDSVDPLLVRAELLAFRREFARAERELTAALPKLPPDHQAAVSSLLAQFSWRQGRHDDAKSHLENAIRNQPSDLKAIRLLCSLTLATERLDELEQWEGRLRELEGPSGTEWRVFRAHRLIVQASEGSDPRLIEAERLQAEVEGMRPTWSPTFRLKGMLFEQQGKPREAVEAYERAIELDRAGAFRDWDIARLVRLIHPEGKPEGTPPVVDRLPASLASSRAGSAQAIARSVAMGDIARAVKDARDAAWQRPNDPVAQIWLGYTLWLAKDLPEAEKAFLLATQLGSKNPQTWRELLGFYMRTAMTDKARTALEGIARDAVIPEPQLSLLLVQGYQLLGDRASAESHFDRVLQTHSDDVDVLLQAGNFFSGTDMDRAETLLRKAVQLQPENRQTHRTLALLLVRRGTDASFQEACGLLATPSSGGAVDPVDQRLHVQLLFRRGGEENRLKAATLLEELIAGSPTVAANDRVALAQIYEAAGKLPKAAEQLSILAADQNPPNAEHAALYADFLVRHLEDAADFATGADEAIKQLEQAGTADLQAVNLRARWLKQVDRQDEIEPLVKKYLAENLPKAADAAAKARMLIRVAQIYDLVDRADLAEALFRQGAAEEPGVRLSLALFLANQGTEEATAEAVDLCIESIQSDATQRTAVALSTVLTTGKPSAETLAKAEPYLADALKKHGRALDLLLALGALRQMTGQTEEADMLFRRVLELSPSNVLALNNLAYLIAPEDPVEAEDYIDRAIAIAGSEPWLMDTRGIVYLSQEQAVEAIKVFQELAQQPTSDPRFYFHLALAYQQAGNAPEARKALDQARAAGLQLHTLVPYEREKLAELDTSMTGVPPVPPESP